MTIPTFVNLGTVNDASSTTTSGPALPASRVNGNVLIAAIEINGTKVISLAAGSISNGWTLYATQIDNNSTLAMAWRIVDGNEAACSFTWTGAHIAMSRCIQFTGNDTTNPIGATDWVTGSSGATTGNGISSTRAGSAVLAIIGLQTGQTPTTPAGWTARASDTFTAGSLAWRTFNTGLVNQGDFVNGSFGNSGVQFALAQIEIMSPGAAAITTTIDQTLHGITQAAAVSPNTATATVAQTLAGFTQALTDTESMPDTISTVLFAPTQALVAAESIPSTIDQTLRGFTQEIDVSDIALTIAQTLPGFTQEFDAGEVPKADIATVFGTLSQEMDATESIPAAIAQTLRGFTQEIDDIAALDTQINMILGQPRPPPPVVVNEVSHQGALTGSGFVRPFALAGASGPGQLIVLQIVSTSTTTTPNAVTSLTNVPGQPVWQQRSAMLGNQTGSAVAVEIWYLVSNSAFGPSNISIGMSRNQDSWETICLEYDNVDTDQPWDDDSSVPASTQNNSLVFPSVPSISGLATKNDYTLQVGYFGSNTTTEPAATSDFTRDAAEQVVASQHTSATAIEISKWVPTASGSLSVGFAGNSSAWCFIADTIRGIATARTALTQEIDVMSNPAAAISTVLRGPMQEIDVMSNPAANIDMTLHSLVQTATVRVDPRGHIDQTLFSILQKVSPTVVFPPGSIVADTIMTLPKLSQEMDVTVSAVSNIAQTLPGLAQEADIVITTPNIDVAIDQTLHGLVQEIDISQTPAAHIAQILNSILQQEVVTVSDPAGAILSDIDQTLPGFTQELDATLEIPVGVDTVLSFAIFGLQQEIDIVEEIPTFIDTTLFNIVPSTFGEIIGDIDQTLTGFSQEIDDDVELIFRTTIDQTLAGFGQQEADVKVEMAAAIDQTLPGLAQEADVTVEMVAAIDQVLAGFQQEADVAVEMDAIIDQTLTGLMQELDATTQDENTITTVLPGFGQNIIVEVDNPTVNPTADIAAELMGFSQRCHIVVKNPKVRHPRGNSGMIMPSKDMPIHPGELELFRRKVYARNVDGLVPIAPVAQTNLTTTRYPRSRPAVNRTPLGKPKS